MENNWIKIDLRHPSLRIYSDSNMHKDQTIPGAAFRKGLLRMSVELDGEFFRDSLAKEIANSLENILRSRNLSQEVVTSIMWADPQSISIIVTFLEQKKIPEKNGPV
mgnify:CR=1 FL=1